MHVSEAHSSFRIREARIREGERWKHGRKKKDGPIGEAE